MSLMLILGSLGMDNSYIYILIGNKSNINHGGKKNKETKYMVFMMVNTRKNNKQHQRKNNSRDNSKSGKKLYDRRTIQRTPAPRPIEKSSLA